MTHSFKKCDYCRSRKCLRFVLPSERFISSSPRLRQTGFLCRIHRLENNRLHRRLHQSSVFPLEPPSLLMEQDELESEYIEQQPERQAPHSLLMEQGELDEYIEQQPERQAPHSLSWSRAN